MTLLQRALNQYVEICQRSQPEKAAAWQQAQALAAAYPELLGELPEMLKAEMLRRKSAGQLIENGEKNE